MAWQGISSNPRYDAYSIAYSTARPAQPGRHAVPAIPIPSTQPAARADAADSAFLTGPRLASLSRYPLA
jgi:hypothetical protein